MMLNAQTQAIVDRTSVVHQIGADGTCLQCKLDRATLIDSGSKVVEAR